MEIKMTGGFSDRLRQIEANVKALSRGLDVEVSGDDTVGSLTDKLDRMLPYPGIEQTRAAAAHYAEALIEQRDGRGE